MNVGRLYAIDISPGVDIARVYKIMEELENQGVWEFEEGHYFNPKDAQFKAGRQ